MAAIQYNSLSLFLGNLFKDYDITSVLLEDMSTYDTPMPQQYYFMVGDNMVAHWSPSGNMGSIIGIRPGSQWSTKYRKFTKLTVNQFKSKLKVKK